MTRTQYQKLPRNMLSYASLCLFLSYRRKPWILIGVLTALSLAGCSFTAWQMYDSNYFPAPALVGDSIE